jgi:hypothetical protein
MIDGHTNAGTGGDETSVRKVHPSGWDKSRRPGGSGARVTKSFLDDCGLGCTSGTGSGERAESDNTHQIW